MKKEIMYDIYNLMKEDFILIRLRDFLILSDNSAEFLYEIFQSCKEKINDDNLKAFIDMAYSTDFMTEYDLKREVKTEIKEMCLSEYIKNDQNFNEMIDVINYLLTCEYFETFDIYDKEEVDFYIHFMITNLIDIIKSTLNEKVPINNLYTHNISFVLNSYTDVVSNLSKTESNNKELTENDIRLNRVKYYKKILTNPEVISLNSYKYDTVVRIASKITDLEKLDKFENIIVFNKMRSNKDFERILDDYAEEFTSVTIDRINRKLGLTVFDDKEQDEIIYNKKITNSIAEDKIMKKILKPEKTIDFK